jgi:capsid protein
MEAGFSTLEMEVAENMGEDWEEMVDQRKYEIQRFEELGIPVPSWAQAEGFAPSNPTDKQEAK